MASFFYRLRADERVRFLVVGGFNTVFAYALFALFELTLDGHYLLSLLLSYAIATVVAFVLHRRVTFSRSGRHKLITDFFRFESVHIGLLALNAALLPVLVEIVGWPSLVAQAAIVSVTAVMSYLLHKFFSFRRAHPPAHAAA
ncbi:GtrA family protein [Marisediminicola senii]|uniref:GtrA family protein n=1 Tax=Marisediminicola senii TaxID=2711233 RepID=UPI0013EA5C69|nr:GtrA family protein [Marisediminicola senii]